MLVPNDGVLMALAREVGPQLHAAGRVLATAESCTGGWIAKLCTDIAGSSEWFDCGFVCYSNQSKTRDLGVPEKLIETEGAVSDAVVRAMAEGAIARTNANVAIAVSGIRLGSAGEDVAVRRTVKSGHPVPLVFQAAGRRVHWGRAGPAAQTTASRSTFGCKSIVLCPSVTRENEEIRAIRISSVLRRKSLGDLGAVSAD